MSLVQTAFRGGVWYASFSLVSQTISWCATLLVARLLTPGDYGLLSIATVLTGYVVVFQEMGVGAAIVQKAHISDQELSSIFWALVFWGALLAAVCLLLAHPTALLFDDPRIVRVTQAVSGMLLLGTMTVVPITLLHRHLRFKAIGLATSGSVIVSCSAMVGLAYNGAGVWTLVAGLYIRAFIQLVMVFLMSGWRPRLHFNRGETRAFLRFGLPVVGGHSLDYLYRSAGARLFGGRALSTDSFGYYSLAGQLARMPNEKIVSLINSVSYPVFAKLQDDPAEFRRFYLRTLQLTALIVMPLYAGGIFLAHDLIPWAIGERWQPAVIPFQILCVSYLATTLCQLCHMMNMAQGRPSWNLRFHVFCAATMPAGFYLAASTRDVAYLALPWLAVYLPAEMVFFVLTLRKVGISAGQIATALRSPIVATVSMLVMLAFVRYGFSTLAASLPTCGAVYLLLSIFLGAVWYASYLVLLRRDLLLTMFRLVRT